LTVRLLGSVFLPAAIPILIALTVLIPIVPLCRLYHAYRTAVVLMLMALLNHVTLHRRHDNFRWAVVFGTSVSTFFVLAGWYRLLPRQVDNFDAAGVLIMSRCGCHNAHRGAVFMTAFLMPWRRSDNAHRRAVSMAVFLMPFPGDDNPHRGGRCDHHALRRASLVTVLMHLDIAVLHIDGAVFFDDLDRLGMMMADTHMLAAAQQGHGGNGEGGNHQFVHGQAPSCYWLRRPQVRKGTLNES